MAATLATLHLVAQRGGHSVSKTALQETCEHIIERHAPRAQGSEVSWALWTSLAWKVQLSANAAKAVASMNDNIVALLALDAHAEGLFPPNSLDLTMWTAQVSTPDALASENWLLAYEAHRQGWLACPTLASDAAFTQLLNAGIAFYDSALNVPQVPSAAGALPGGDLPEFYG